MLGTCGTALALRQTCRSAAARQVCIHPLTRRGCLSSALVQRTASFAAGRPKRIFGDFLGAARKSLGRRDELLASAVKDVMVAIDQAATSAIGALKLRKRKALPSTNTLDSAMAPAAKIGDSRTPYAG